MSIEFWTTNTPRLTLDASGNFWPTTTNVVSCGKSGQLWTAVWATNGAIQTSDRRLKMDIAPVGYGLDHLLNLKPVRFRWRDQPSHGRKLGLIAQEVREIVPEAVVEGDDARKTLGMNYSDLIPVLINGIQEQQTLIDSQEQRIARLEGMIEQLIAVNTGSAVPTSIDGE